MNVENPHLRRAELLLSQRRYDLAEDQLRQAIAAEPNEGIAYSYLALCLAEREAWGEATEAAQRGIGLDPGNARAHYVLGVVLRDRNMLKEARSAIGEAVRLDPHEADFWAGLASIELAEKHWRAALEAADRGLEADAEHEACVNIRAMALTKLGDRAAATAAIDATLARNPENAVTHANMGWAKLHEGKAREAMVSFREALRLDPEMEWARAGIVEAMKARSFIYRIFLAYFLFMGKLRGRGQWMVLIGGYVLFRVVMSISDANPALSPWLTPLIVAYVVFALGTVVSVPLFNLFLFSSRFGRYALSDRQRRGAMVFGASLVPGIVFLVLWGTVSRPGMQLGALLCGLWVIPVALATLARAGKPLLIMGGLAAALGLACAGLCYSIVAFQRIPFENAGVAYAIGCVGSAWVANIVVSLGPRVKR